MSETNWDDDFIDQILHKIINPSKKSSTMLILHPVEKEDVCIYTVAKTVQDIALIIQKHGTQYTPILKRLKVEMEQLNEVEALLAYAEEVVDNYSPNGTEKGVTKGGTKGVTQNL